MTTARKAVTLLLSYMIFTKPLTEQHGTGLLLIGMGIVLKMVPEIKPPSPRKSAVGSNGGDPRADRPQRGESNIVGKGEAGEEEIRPLV